MEILYDLEKKHDQKLLIPQVLNLAQLVYVCSVKIIIFWDKLLKIFLRNTTASISLNYHIRFYVQCRKPDQYNMVEVDEDLRWSLREKCPNTEFSP